MLNNISVVSILIFPVKKNGNNIFVCILKKTLISVCEEYCWNKSLLWITYNDFLIYCYIGIKAKQNGTFLTPEKQMLPEVHLVPTFIILSNFMSDYKGNNLHAFIQ